MLWNIYNELKEDVYNKIHNDVIDGSLPPHGDVIDAKSNHFIE